MKVVEVIKTIKDNTYTYNLMGHSKDAPKYVHINNHNNNENAVIVPIDKIKQLLEN